jgi:hypothetical protein
MNITTIVRTAGVLSAACLSVGLVYAAFTTPGPNLYINGGLASTHVFQHNGMACVPLADVARALNMSVVAKSDGYSISPAGGSGQLNGMNGKIGDKLTNGQWVLTVVKAFRTDNYVHQFDTDKSSADQATDDLVVVVVRMKNARQDSKGISLPGTGSTAVTDLDDHSYSKMTFGGMDDRAGYPTLLPGSAVDFAMIFSVPKSEKLGDFVYQVYPSDGPKPPTFRVSLASLNQ